MENLSNNTQIRQQNHWLTSKELAESVQDNVVPADWPKGLALIPCGHHCLLLTEDGFFEIPTGTTHFLTARLGRRNYTVLKQGISLVQLKSQQHKKQYLTPLIFAGACWQPLAGFRSQPIWINCVAITGRTSTQHGLQINFHAGVALQLDYTLASFNRLFIRACQQTKTYLEYHSSSLGYQHYTPEMLVQLKFSPFFAESMNQVEVMSAGWEEILDYGNYLYFSGEEQKGLAQGRPLMCEWTPQVILRQFSHKTIY